MNITYRECIFFQTADLAPTYQAMAKLNRNVSLGIDVKKQDEKIKYNLSRLNK